MTNIVPESGSLGRKRIAVRLSIVACLLAMLAASSNCFAQSASDANTIIKSLAPTLGQTVTPGYGGNDRRPVIVGRTTVYINVRHLVSLEVYFRYNSAEITHRARVQLAALGRALSSPQLAPYRYLIAGHTDSIGSDEYNLDLSQRRAKAVRDYLVSAFPINSDRLLVVGFSFRHLKRPDAPHAAVNRRVEVALIVP
jgi:outer membrane protein OmpA-like peptidoglycan-associated protein